jgi:hypothetical protein
MKLFLETIPGRSKAEVPRCCGARQRPLLTGSAQPLNAGFAVGAVRGHFCTKAPYSARCDEGRIDAGYRRASLAGDMSNNRNSARNPAHYARHRHVRSGSRVSRLLGYILGPRVAILGRQPDHGMIKHRRGAITVGRDTSVVWRSLNDATRFRYGGRRRMSRFMGNCASS